MVEAKSERFEMRLDPIILGRLDDWRRARVDVPSRAEAIRRLVDAGLDAQLEPRRFEVTNAQKLILYMLCDIYERTAPDGEFNPRFIRHALMYGHHWGLEWQYGGMFPTREDDRALVTEVVDILEMWSFVEEAVERLSATEKRELDEATGGFGERFFGFDGNHEIEHKSVMAFLVEDLDRFTRFRDRAHLNSHSESLSIHRRMVAAFAPIKPRLSGRGLDLGELIEIIGARRRPNR